MIAKTERGNFPLFNSTGKNKHANIENSLNKFDINHFFYSIRSSFCFCLPFLMTTFRSRLSIRNRNRFIIPERFVEFLCQEKFPFLAASFSTKRALMKLFSAAFLCSSTPATQNNSYADVFLETQFIFL